MNNINLYNHNVTKGLSYGYYLAVVFSSEITTCALQIFQAVITRLFHN